MSKSKFSVNQGMPLKGVKDESRSFVVSLAVSKNRLIEMLQKEGLASMVVAVRRLTQDDVDAIEDSKTAGESLENEDNEDWESGSKDY